MDQTRHQAHMQCFGALAGTARQLQVPPPPDLIDNLVAARACEFLEVVFDTVRPASVLTWGISDRYTWMPIWHARTDGLRNRCLPLDEDMRPKPFMSVIRHFCGNAGD
jgi:endo-1,4-beta-xylanase